MQKLDLLPGLSDTERESIEKLRKKPITFAWQARGNKIYSNWVMFLLKQQQIFESTAFLAITNEDTDATDGVLSMAGQTMCEYVYIMDPTIAPPNESTIRLMSHELDVVGLPLYQYDATMNLFQIDAYKTSECTRIFRPQPPEVGLDRVFGCSLRSCLISKRVLETFTQVKEHFCIWSDLIDKKFEHAHPHIIFFAKLQALGFDAWIDWGCELSDVHGIVRMNAPSMETFISHGILSYTIGSQREQELLATETGREELADILRRSRDAYRPGPPPGDGAGHVHAPAGETAPVGA